MILLYGNLDEVRAVAEELLARQMSSLVTGRVQPGQVRHYYDRCPEAIIIFPDSLEDLELGLVTLRRDYLGHILLLRRLEGSLSLKGILEWGASDWLVDLQILSHPARIARKVARLLHDRPFSTNATPASREEAVSQLEAEIEPEITAPPVASLLQPIQHERRFGKLPEERITRDFYGDPIALKKSQWDILAYLMAHPKTLMTPLAIARGLEKPVVTIVEKLRIVRREVAGNCSLENKWRVRLIVPNQYILDDSGEDTISTAPPKLTTEKLPG